MDISSGWDAGSRATLLALYGEMLLSSAQDADVEEALAYLVRALVLMIGMRRQQAEGVRDLLFSLANALRRRDDPMGRRIALVAERCVDYSSWFFPCMPIGIERTEGRAT